MEVLKVDFGLLRGIIRDKSNKSKDTIDSAICLNQYLNLEMNSVEEIRKMKQDESANEFTKLVFEKKLFINQSKCVYRRYFLCRLGNKL